MLRRPPGFVLVALVLALAGLVAVVSRDRPLWSGLRDEARDRPEIFVGVVALCGLGMLLAAGIAFVAHRTTLGRRSGRPPLGATLLRALPITAATLAVSSLLMIAHTDLGRGGEADDAPPFAVDLPGRPALPLWLDWGAFLVLAVDRDRPQDAAGEPPPPDDGIPYRLLVLAVAAAAIAGTAAWWTHRKGARIREPLDDDAGPGARDRRAVHGALVGTIDAMLADPDPNTAIRGAYARLLEGLEACGRGRRAHEGPVEHLHRALTTLHARPEPLQELIALFELARFSVHPLNASHRERALAALRDVAADLQHAERLPAAPAPARRAGRSPSASARQRFARTR